MHSADFHDTRPDHLLALDELSPRQEAVSYLIRSGIPHRLLHGISDLNLARLCCAISEYAIKLPGVGDTTWQQTWGNRITGIEIKDNGTILFTLTCFLCKGPAVFTPRGPHCGSCPEPACEKCEGDYE